MLIRARSWTEVGNRSKRLTTLRMFSVFGLILGLGFAEIGLAGQTIPDCLSRGKALTVDNAQVLQWKTSTSNQYLNRARVEGSVVRLFADRNGHEHFEIQIGPDATDILEVVYNSAFGKLPEVKIGMRVEACGDYITSTARSGNYEASPSGAIIHWVHQNPRGKGHESGYLVIDGVLYGYKLSGQNQRGNKGLDIFDFPVTSLAPAS